jgi:hypothetical protein
MYVTYGWMSSCITSLFVIYYFGMHTYEDLRLGGEVEVYYSFQSGFKFVKL